MKKLLLFLFLFAVFSLTAQRTQKRIALVIGNANYSNAQLDNPINDANLMERTLRKLNFEVTKITNANKTQMEEAVINFTEKIGDYDLSLFYYAGHGIQIEGKNYLIPIGADLPKKSYVKIRAFDIELLNEEFAKNWQNANIMILDACRENPYRSWMRGGERGFKRINPSVGTLIAFATSEGA
ncbi:MAG: caspase family protein [Bacteroidota bacterium]